MPRACMCFLRRPSRGLITSILCVVAGNDTACTLASLTTSASRKHHPPQHRSLRDGTILHNNQYASILLSMSCLRCGAFLVSRVKTGLVLIAYGATEINPIGLLISLCSVTCGGLNQVIVQSQLQRDGAKYLKLPTAQASTDPASTAGERAEGDRAPQLKLNPIVFTCVANRLLQPTPSALSIEMQLLRLLLLPNPEPSVCGITGVLAVGR